MKRYISIYFSVGMIVCMLGGEVGAGKQSESLSEAYELEIRVQELNRAEKYKEAIPMAERSLRIFEKTLGPSSKATAKALSNLAELYRAIGMNVQAVPLFERALTIFDKTLGREHIDTVSSLRNLALSYYETGAYTHAEPLFKQLLAILEKHLGLEHQITAQIVNKLGDVYMTLASYDQAESFYQRALEINEKVLGAKHRDAAIVLSNLGNVYMSTGDYRKAKSIYQRVLAIVEETFESNDPTIAPLFGMAGQLYEATGEYDKAEPLFLRALLIVEKRPGLDHLTTVKTLINVGNFYLVTGKHGKAEPLYQQAIEIVERQLGLEHPVTAEAGSSLADLYRVTGAYGKAEPLYQRALAIKEKTLGLEHRSTAATLNSLAILYCDTGAYGKAEPLHQRALAIQEKTLGTEHPETAETLNSLANLYRTTGAYGKAERLYQRALTIQEKTLGPEHPNMAVTHSNLAVLYQVMGAYGKAEPLYQRALAIKEKTLGLEHRSTAKTLNNMASLYQAMGAYGKAESLYQRALAIQEKTLGPEHPATAQLLHSLAMQRWATGDTVAALSFLERSLAIDAKNSELFLLTGDESRKLAYLNQLLGRTFSSISLSASLSIEQATRIGYISVLQTKGRVLDSMSNSLTLFQQSVDPTNRALIDRLTELIQEQSKLTLQGPGEFKPEAYRQRLQELSENQEQLETELLQRSVEFRQHVAPVTVAAIQAAIPEGAALVEWYCYFPFNPNAKDEESRWRKPRYVAYVLKNKGEPTVVDVGAADTIELLINDFRQGLSNPINAYIKDVAKELSDKLLKPLQPVLRNVQRLLISPDCALNLIPFGALLDETGDYLGEKWDISYLTSGRDLVRMGSRPHAKGEAIVVADPNYGPTTSLMAQAEPFVQQQRSVDLDRVGMQFKPLSGTRREAEALKKLLKIKGNNVLTQTRANEAHLKQVHGPRILHIATHGFFLKDNELPTSKLGLRSFSQDNQPVPFGENPLLRSGLALAGANLRHSGEKDDGILTAAEVAQMDLRGTQLVVLSACETGVGDVQNGEGVYGLRRALVLAGAESQVTSLWKVADDATKDLMVDYYQRLLKGEGRSEALRHAQLAMMKSKDRSHPYYWAAFVPIGDWRPLAQIH